MNELGQAPTEGRLLINASRLRPDQDEVTVRVPALRRYVSALRSFATALVAQCDLTVDDIEDVQMAIDEACALLLPHVDRSRPWIDLCFHVVEGNFGAHVEVMTSGPAQLDHSGLSWIVLEALCDDVHVLSDGRSLAIGFTKQRGSGRQ